MSRTRWIFLVVIFLAGLVGCSAQGSGPSSSLIAEEQDQSSFERADTPQPFDFPQDLGPHPDFQTEWWYYTGNLQTADGTPFGYQFTIFRRALEPAAERTKRESGWATDQIYMGHFAVSDGTSEEFHAFERFSRGAAGLAGAELPYRVWIEDWQVTETGPDSYHMTAAADGIIVDLTMQDIKGPIPQGEDGYHRKGPEAGNASYYYSQTRLETSGTITINGDLYEVSGLSWKDHEYSTSALSEGQVGWDWFSLQLDDFTDLMVYNVRFADGTVYPTAEGTYVDTLGEATLLSFSDGDYSFEVLDTWTSPHSGATYPAGWILRVPSQGLELTITPIFADQELNVSYTYWEGAVTVEGIRDGERITGSGYVELTGYAESMEDQF